MIRRHSLVWLKSPPLSSDSPVLTETWFEAGHPFMVCRTRAQEELSLGFCLPRGQGEAGSPRRLAVSGKISEIQEMSRPPDVAEITTRRSSWDPHGKERWGHWPQAPEGCSLRLIGSRMWENLTGVRYTSASSDLDLVLDLVDASQLDEGAAYLTQISAMSPCNLDAELSIPKQGEVHWKEWISGMDPLLVKSVASVELRSREGLTQGS